MSALTGFNPVGVGEKEVASEKCDRLRETASSLESKSPLVYLSNVACKDDTRYKGESFGLNVLSLGRVDPIPGLEVTGFKGADGVCSMA